MSIDLAAIAAQATPAVVGVQRHGRHRSRPGSGTVIDTDTVLTTAHNAGTRAGSSVTITFPDGHHAEGVITAASEDLDLAVISVTTEGTTPLRWAADHVQPTVGQAVVAVAAPGGTTRTTPGVVAGLASRVRTRSGAPIDAVAEHTAPMVRGASGGPVLDADGGVIGVNVNRAGGGIYQAAIATAALQAAVADLSDGVVPRTRRLGVTLTPAPQARHLRDAVGLPPRDGVLIAGVAEGSPADRAGLQRGDLLVAVAGSPLRTIDDLWLALRGQGASVALTLLRGGLDEQTAEVTFDESTSADTDGDIG